VLTINRLPRITNTILIFGARKTTFDFGWSIPDESHTAFELLFVLDGCQESTVDGKKYFVHANELIFIPPSYRHSNRCVSKEGMTVFVIHFDINDLNLQQRLIQHVPTFIDAHANQHGAISAIMQEFLAYSQFETFSTEDKLSIEILLFQLVQKLLTFTPPENDTVIQDKTALVLAKKIADLIEANFTQYTLNPFEFEPNILSIKMIAQQLNISNSYATNVFKKVYDKTPSQFLNELRFNHSKYLLRQPDLTIQHVAYLVGYENATHFSRQFKRMSGLTPKEYRR
jgi:AraC-like DNA-binding protein